MDKKLRKQSTRSKSMAKRLEINKDLELRLIDRQTNKVKQSLNLFDVIETIDREKIAIEIAKICMIK